MFRENLYWKRLLHNWSLRRNGWAGSTKTKFHKLNLLHEYNTNKALSLSWCYIRLRNSKLKVSEKHKKITTKISERKHKRKDGSSYIVGAFSSHKTLVTLVPTVKKKKITKTKISFIHDDSVELVVKISIYESFNIIYFYAFKDFHICLMSRYMPRA